MAEPGASCLEVAELDVRYGGIQALTGVDLHVDQGEIVAVIGANGAGKSTLLRTIAGVKSYERGRVTFLGESLPRQSHQVVRKGVTLVPEGRRIFAALTVRENLLLGGYSQTDKKRVEASMERVFDLFPVLRERHLQVGGTLSGGEQQMLAIGRALMSRPKLLLLDEPSMGLAPLMVQKIFEVVRTVADEGMTVLLVEQNAKLALEVSQRGYVMESGEITLTDDSSKLLASPKVREAYLGE
jgi:branched-chain amino acid transport system ATP-binding protein